MAGSANNITIQPVNCLWQVEALYQFDLSSLVDPDGTYFLLNSAKDAVEYYVYFDLDGGATDPAPAGKTGIAVANVTGDSATVLATKTAAAITAEADFGASSSGKVVTVKLVAIGATTDAVDVDSGVVVTVCRRGKDFDLGLLEGDVELSLAPSNFIVTSHQSGLTPRAALFQGIETAEVSTVLQETINSQLSELYGLYGTSGFIPAGGTSVYGIGTSKQGQNLLIDAARLILRPVNAANALTDTTLMLAIPIPDTLVFSGENPKTLAVTWQGFVDDTKDSRVSVLAFNDSGQAGLDL